MGLCMISRHQASSWQARNGNRRGWLDAGEGEGEAEHLPDTWADMRGWGKGLLWINGFNLGWYWPVLGPQMRTFVPGPLLHAGSNEVVLLEFTVAPQCASIALVEAPDFFGPDQDDNARTHSTLTPQRDMHRVSHV